MPAINFSSVTGQEQIWTTLEYKTQNGFDSTVDAHLKAIWLDQVSELKPGALNKNFLRYASSNTNMKQKIR